MLRMAMYTTIKTLFENGKNKTQIAKMTGHDWKTINKVIKAVKAGKEIPDKKPHPRILDKNKEQMIKWIEEGLTAIRMHEELSRMGIKVGYTTVKDFVKAIKKNQNIFIRILPCREKRLRLILAMQAIL